MSQKNRKHFTFSWLPNTITLFNLFCGFLSIMSVVQGRHGTAALLILISLVWDSLDGNVARAFKNPTAIGRELDSLADIVSFVVAPTVLVVSCWHLPMNFITLLMSFSFLGAGAYRLARFNLNPPVKVNFEGLPTPAAAVILVALVLAYEKNAWSNVPFFAGMVQALMLLLSFLMVSHIAYPKLSAMKFKKWKSLFYIEVALFGLLTALMNVETALSTVSLVFLFISPAYCLPGRPEEESPVPAKSIK